MVVVVVMVGVGMPVDFRDAGGWTSGGGMLVAMTAVGMIVGMIVVMVVVVVMVGVGMPVDFRSGSGTGARTMTLDRHRPIASVVIGREEEVVAPDVEVVHRERLSVIR